jgi:hypothetical protein
MLITGIFNHYDAKLALELAEHALLIQLGWRWTVYSRKMEPRFAWIPPPWHKGSQIAYFSRSHAINSVKRHVLGFEHGFMDSEV